MKSNRKVQLEKDMATMQSALKKHFEKMHFLQSDAVDISAQTVFILQQINRSSMLTTAYQLDALAAQKKSKSQEEEEEDDAEISQKVESGKNNKQKESFDKGDISSFENKQGDEILAGIYSSEDVKQLLEAMENQIKEHSDVLLISSNHSAKFKESLKECNHAADQIAQQLQAIEDRSLDNAEQYFDRLGNDPKQGGNARLMSSININVKSVEDYTRKLQKDIANIRKEFIESNQQNDLLEVASLHSYEKIRDSLSHIRRLSQKKSDESNKSWLEFEKKCREKQIEEMRNIYAKYSGSSSDVGDSSSSFERKLMDHRAYINQKLKGFHSTVLNISDNNIDKITHDADALMTWRQKIIPWELREQKDMESWLAASTQYVEERYNTVLDELRNHHARVLQHIDYIRLHKLKLSHLRNIPLDKQQMMRERSGRFSVTKPRSPSKSSYNSRSFPPSLNKASSGTVEDISIPSNSMRLGSRIVQLGKLVSIDDDECLSILLQLLHEVPPDSIFLKRLQYCNSYYAKLGKPRKTSSSQNQ